MTKLPAPLTTCLYGDRTRIAVVMGNCTHMNGAIWCHDLETGSRVDLHLVEMHEDPVQFEANVLVSIIEGWAEGGNADAAWWLGWFYEGANHSKSVWYYIAAIRMSPADAVWAFGRIQELCGKLGDWKEAIAKAKSAAHVLTVTATSETTAAEEGEPSPAVSNKP